MTVRVLALLVSLAMAATATCPRWRAPRVASAHLSADAAVAAFRQGIEAAQLGLGLGACPFAGDDAARAWKAGWRWWHGQAPA